MGKTTVFAQWRMGGAWSHLSAFFSLFSVPNIAMVAEKNRKRLPIYRNFQEEKKKNKNNVFFLGNRFFAFSCLAIKKTEIFCMFQKISVLLFDCSLHK